MSETEELNTNRLVDTVYSHLRRLIVRHDLPPGTHLSVPALAIRFGVSRSPVREAVLQAVRHGLAVEKPRSGTFVARFDAADLQPLFELREALEGMAARLTAERRTAEELKRISKTLDNQRRALAKDDIEAFIEADMEFHRAIFLACGNPALIEALDQLYFRIQTALSLRVAPTGPEHALSDHDAILIAIAKEDGEAAEGAARHHIRNAIRRILDTDKIKDGETEG